MSAPDTTTPSLADLRRSYGLGGLSSDQLAPTWLEQFEAWFAAARVLTEPNAMVLSTATPDGVPSARTVLLKAVDPRGFVLFTNYTSRKGTEALANPHASLVFPWVDIERQVVVVGTVTRVSPEETSAYFHSRPRGSQLGAWASHQSSVIGSRAELTDRLAALDARWPGEVPVPDFWGGLRVAPVSVEFWQGRPDRLHDRHRYRLVDGAWVTERLAP